MGFLKGTTRDIEQFPQMVSAHQHRGLSDFETASRESYRKRLCSFVTSQQSTGSVGMPLCWLDERDRKAGTGFAGFQKMGTLCGSPCSKDHNINGGLF